MRTYLRIRLKASWLRESELKQFYRDNVDRIYKFFYFKTLQKDIAEDLTSETFLKFVQSIKADREIQNHRSFLLGISKNIFMEFLRDKYKNPVVQYIELDFEIYIDQLSEKIESGATLEDRILPYIEKLPESQREVAHLRFIQKMSLKDICNQLHKNMNYVKTTQKRAIASLKELVACTP